MCNKLVSLSHTERRYKSGSLQTQCDMHLLDPQRPCFLCESLSSKSFTLSGELLVLVSCLLVPGLGPEVVLEVVLVFVVVTDVVVVDEVRDVVVFVGFCAV